MAIWIHKSIVHGGFPIVSEVWESHLGSAAVWAQGGYFHLEMYGEAQGSKGFHSVSVQHPDVFQSKDVSQRRTSPGLAQVQIPSSHRSRIPVNGNVE